MEGVLLWASLGQCIVCFSVAVPSLAPVTLIISVHPGKTKTQILTSAAVSWALARAGPGAVCINKLFLLVTILLHPVTERALHSVKNRGLERGLMDSWLWWVLWFLLWLVSVIISKQQ